MPHELAQAIRRYSDARTGPGPYATTVPGLSILRSDDVKPPIRRVSKPIVCFVAQGAKWSRVRGEGFMIRAGEALAVGVETLSLNRIAEASPEKPFLGLAVELDLTVMREVADILETPPRATGERGNDVFLTNFEGALADCLLRLVRLLDAPDAIPVLYPSIMREICYWLLVGPCGDGVAKLAMAGDRSPRIIDAIHSLRERFDEPIRVDELASAAQMSASAFQRRFKAMTSLTPHQYQKRLRLQEARRLLVADGVNTETAAFEVGYRSTSQFSREYSRLYGIAPKQDARKVGASFR